MKAIYSAKSGPPESLELIDMPRPTCGAGEILVQVIATTVTAGDIVLRNLRFPLSLVMGAFGFKRKAVPGHEFAGVVVEVGAGVSRFKVGDEVFGTTTKLETGAYAEFICLPESWKGGLIAAKPKALSFAEAAALPVGALTALALLDKAGLQSGQSFLVYGASGSVGSYAVQIGRALGAEVTDASSARNAEMVRSLGATDIIDYRAQDMASLTKRFDVVFDAVGKLAADAQKALVKEGGVFVSVQSLTQESPEALNKLIAMVEAGQVKPFIDQHFPLEQAAEAHRYVESGRKRGNVVLDVALSPEGHAG